MNIWDISPLFLVLGFALWALTSIIFVWKNEFIGAAIIAFFFFGQVLLDLVLKDKSIPNGQLLLIIFGPLLLVSVLFKQKARARAHNLVTLILFAIAIIMSIIWNGLSFWGEKSALVPIVFAIIVYFSVSDMRELKLILGVFMTFLIISTVVAGMQFSGHENWYLPSQLLQSEAGGFTRGIGLASHFSQTGLYCAAAIPLAVMGSLTEQGRWKKFMWVTVGIAALAGLAFTALRAGLIGGAVGAVLSLFLWNWKKAIPYLLLATLSVGVLFVSLPFLRSASSALAEHTETIDDSARMRPMLIEMGLGLWKRSPVFGNGPKGLARSRGGAGDPHNTYIDVLINYGVVGLLFFLAAPIIGYLRLKNAMRRLPQHKATFIGLSGALVSAYIVGIVHSVDYVPLFWLFPALALSVDRIRENSVKQNSGRAVQSRAREK